MVGVLVFSIIVLTIIWPVFHKGWGWIFYVALMSFKILVTISIIILATSNHLVYERYGWTPLSAVFGNRVYEKAAKHGKAAPKKTIKPVDPTPDRRAQVHTR